MGTPWRYFTVWNRCQGDETLSAFSKQLLEYPVSPGMVYEIQMGQDRTAREPGKIFFPWKEQKWI